MDRACSGVGTDTSRTNICGHSMLKCWKRLEQDIQMWTQNAQVLEETGARQANMDTACSGVGRDWSRTDRCGHSMLRCWKILEQDRQTDVGTAGSRVGKDWSRTHRCGHNMLRCWKKQDQDRQMWTQHGKVLEKTGVGQTYVDRAR